MMLKFDVYSRLAWRIKTPRAPAPATMIGVQLRLIKRSIVDSTLQQKAAIDNQMVITQFADGDVRFGAALINSGYRYPVCRWFGVDAENDAFLNDEAGRRR